jgi:hypothetical protein
MQHNPGENMQDDKELSKYTVEEALELGGIKSPSHYAEGNLGMGVAVLAISKKAFSEQRTEDVARFLLIEKEINGALAALRRVDLNDERLPQSVIQAVCEARDRLREAGAKNT